MADDMIDMSALEAQMQEVNAKFEEFRKITQESSKKVFYSAVEAFFKAYPEVYAIRWTQYTPYFNDGDSCEFSVHYPSFYSQEDFENGEDDYEYNSWAEISSYVREKVANNDNRYGDLEEYKREIAEYEEMSAKLGPRLEEIQDGIDRFTKLFNKINDDTMLALFGDHVQVTVTPKGIDIEEHDHD